MSGYNNADIEYFALYIATHLNTRNGYVKVNSKNSTLIFGKESKENLKHSNDIISPLSGKRLGTIHY